jgi:hypothetical protein
MSLTDAQQARLIELALTGTDERVVQAIAAVVEEGIGLCSQYPFQDYCCKTLIVGGLRRAHQTRKGDSKPDEVFLMCPNCKAEFAYDYTRGILDDDTRRS